jgi:hypothetical protein
MTDAAWRRSALAERPNSGFPLYGIAQADAAAGDKAAASIDFQTLLTAWKRADADLPQMVAARSWFGQAAVAATAATP